MMQKKKKYSAHDSPGFDNFSSYYYRKKKTKTDKNRRKKQKKLWVNTIRLDFKSEGKNFLNKKYVLDNRILRYKEEEWLLTTLCKIEKKNTIVLPIIKGNSKFCYAKSYECKKKLLIVNVMYKQSNITPI
jgi:hypothetical protein